MQRTQRPMEPQMSLVRPTSPHALFPSGIRPAGRVSRGAIAALAALSCITFASAPATAAGRLDARYVLTVGGVELGRGAVTVKADDTTYEISGSGRISGALRAVSSGKGQVAARGALNGAQMVPQVYAMHAESEGKKERSRISMASGAVKSTDVHPPLRPLPDRVPVTGDLLASIVDPLSGAFVYVPGNGDLLAPSVCNRSLSVFDGRQRYDLQLTYSRRENVQTKGYDGPALVCQVRYTPVAGHRTNRESVKFMQNNKDMFIWLAPISGTRLLAPFRANVATMIGPAQLEATTFTASSAGSGSRGEP